MDTLILRIFNGNHCINIMAHKLHLISVLNYFVLKWPEVAAEMQLLWNFATCQTETPLVSLCAEVFTLLRLI